VPKALPSCPWSPLARGFVAGNRRRQDYGETSRAKTDDYAHQLYYQDSDFQTVDRITEVARQQGVSNAQIALAWLLGQPGVTAPIIWRQQARTIGRSGQGGEPKTEPRGVEELI